MDIQSELLSGIDIGMGDSNGSSPKSGDASTQGDNEAASSPNRKGDEHRQKNEQGSKKEKADADGATVDYEKRFKDTQSKFNEEHKARLELEARLNILEAQASTGTSKEKTKEVNQILKEFKDTFDDDPQEAIEKVFAALESRIEAVGARDDNRERETINRQEQEARKKYSDYDDLIRPFVPRLQSDKKLYDQWMADGGTAESAYSLAKRVSQFDKYIETGELPPKGNTSDSTKESPVRKDENRQPPKTLAGINSTPPSGNGNAKRIPETPMEMMAALFPD